MAVVRRWSDEPGYDPATVEAIMDDESSVVIDLLESDLIVAPPEYVGVKTGSVFGFASTFVRGKAWWVQFLTISIVAALTYSYNNSNGGTTNVQLAIMTTITLVGASPFRDTHLIPASIGAFVGGHNIIGATGIESITASDEPKLKSYLWLLLLSLVVSLVWRKVVKRKFLDGYAGRLGTTTFIGMNMTFLLVWGPIGVVDWNRYVFGFIQWVHLAEEDAAPSMASAWAWTEEVELAIGYVLAVVWLSTISGVSRIWHLSWQKQQLQKNKSSVTEPLNNVLVPVLWALLSVLVVNSTNYRYAPGLYNGFAVGSYVGMASLSKINSVPNFAVVGLVAAGWGLALAPAFVGFAGKSGFLAMLGHVTYEVFEKIV